VVVNACIKTLTALSHGEAPVAGATAADARISEQEKVTNAAGAKSASEDFLHWRRIPFGRCGTGPHRDLKATSRWIAVLERRQSLGGGASRREVAPSVEFTGTPERGLATIPIRGGGAGFVLYRSRPRNPARVAPPLLLMDKKSVECFKEKCFMLFRFF